MIAATPATVELHALGFVVMRDGHPMPKMLPGRVMVFAGRPWAKQLAAAINADDMPWCHEIIAEHGRVYEVAA